MIPLDHHDQPSMIPSRISRLSDIIRAIKVITIDIYHDDGSVTVEPEGFSVNKAAATKKAFEKALGLHPDNRVSSIEAKPAEIGQMGADEEGKSESQED